MAQDLTIPGTTFPATVSSIITSDLVRGSVQGSDPNTGDANKQGVALGNRTAYLKASVDIWEAPEHIDPFVSLFGDSSPDTSHSFTYQKNINWGEAPPWANIEASPFAVIQSVVNSNPGIVLAFFNFKKPLRYNTFNYKFAAKTTNWAGSSPKLVDDAEVLLSINKWDNGANLEIDRVAGVQIPDTDLDDGNTFRTGTFDLTAVTAGTPLVAVLAVDFPGLSTFDFLFTGGKTRFFFTA